MSEDLTTYQNSDGHWISEQEHRRIVAEKDLAYQQLMAQAVRFAEGVWQFIPRKDARQGRDAYEFLQSPEAQAWKEQPK